MRRFQFLLFYLILIGLVSCRKDEIIENNKAYLDFLKDKFNIRH